MKNNIIAMRTGDFDLENDGQFWSEADKHILITCFNEGMGISEMALQMGHSEPAIVQQLMKDQMFQHETQTRKRREPSRKCRCPQCDEYRTCPRSPLNTNDTFCSMEGEIPENA